MWEAREALQRARFLFSAVTLFPLDPAAAEELGRRQAAAGRLLRRVERNTLVSAEQAVIVHVVAREVVALLAPRLTRIEELLAGREPTAATPGLYRVRRKEDVDASDGGGRASAVGRRL